MAKYVLLTQILEVDDLMAEDKGRTLLFKHSLTCPVSHAAFRELESFLAQELPEDLTVRLIEVQNARPASNRVAEKTGVRHESPQALLIEKGAVIWHRSHWNIDARSLVAATSPAAG